MDYKHKYLKYKSKYLELQKMIGGEDDHASYYRCLDSLTNTYKISEQTSTNILYKLFDTTPIKGKNFMIYYPDERVIEYILTNFNDLKELNDIKKINEKMKIDIKKMNDEIKDKKKKIVKFNIDFKPNIILYNILILKTVYDISEEIILLIAYELSFIYKRVENGNLSYVYEINGYLLADKDIKNAPIKSKDVMNNFIRLKEIHGYDQDFLDRYFISPKDRIMHDRAEEIVGKNIDGSDSTGTIANIIRLEKIHKFSRQDILNLIMPKGYRGTVGIKSDGSDSSDDFIKFLRLTKIYNFSIDQTIKIMGSSLYIYDKVGLKPDGSDSTAIFKNVLRLVNIHKITKERLIQFLNAHTPEQYNELGIDLNKQEPGKSEVGIKLDGSDSKGSYKLFIQAENKKKQQK